MLGRLVRGFAAGCAGIAALEIAGYVDMGLRGRPASDSPTKLGEKLADAAGLELGEGEHARARASALGSLFGYADGFGLGVAYGAMVDGPGPRLVPGALLLAAGAWLGSNGPLMASGLTDPRRWSRSDWLSDLVPHLAYGVVTATAYAAMSSDTRSG